MDNSGDKFGTGCFPFDKEEKDEIIDILLENILEFYNKLDEYKSCYYVSEFKSVINNICNSTIALSDGDFLDINFLLKNKFKSANKCSDFKKFDNFISHRYDGIMMESGGESPSREEIVFYFKMIEKALKIYLEKFSEKYTNLNGNDRKEFIQGLTKTLILYWMGVKMGCMKRDSKFENNIHILLSEENIKKDLSCFIPYMRNGNFFKTKVKNGLNMEMYYVPEFFEKEDKWNELFDSFSDWLIKDKSI